jgi:beta-N-acetylhexosaminidase
MKGQLFMMGFDGTSVTPHIKELIEKHHVGNLLLTAKNLKCETYMSQAY